MNNEMLKNLTAAVSGLNINKNQSWKEFSILGIGSENNIVVTPDNDMTLRAALEFCHGNKINVRVLGAGGNILGSDKRFDGIFLRLNSSAFTGVAASHIHATAGTGVTLAEFLKYCAKKGLGGYSALAGIPGTIGGAVKMNAGAHGVAINDILEEICGFYPDGTPWCADVSELHWDYRKVNIPDDVIITAVICKLKKVDSAEELSLINNELLWRKNHFPHGRSVGCVFKNPLTGVSAGQLIDSAGCKGHRIGGALVSDVHANYFINDADATEKDYADLMIYVLNKVFYSSGVKLEPEIKFIDRDTELRVRNEIKPLNVLVLKGGDSHEREISLQSGHEVEDALLSLGHKVRGIDIKHLNDWDGIGLKDGEIVFPVLHGGFGEDGEIQKLLEESNIPFVGSGSRSCLLAMDKIESRKIMLEHGLPTPEFAFFESANVSFPDNLTLPVVIKPSLEGSTVGITLLKNLDKWHEALELALKYSDRVIVEDYIKGIEITVGILDGKPLPPVEIEYPGELFDYDAKYKHQNGKTQYICPSKSLSGKLIEKVREIALAFASSIEVRHLTRVDLIVDEKGVPYILEANNMPGFTSDSLLPKAALSSGIPFPVLCSKLVVLALEELKK